MSSVLVGMCLTASSTPTSGFGQQKTATPAPAPTLDVLWQRPIEMPADVNTAPWLAVGESALFLAGPKVSLTAYDLANTEKPRSSKWMSTAPPVIIGANVAVIADGAIVVLRQDRDEVVWRANLDAPAATIFVFGTHVGVVAGQSVKTWDATGTAGWHAELTAAATTPFVFANERLFVGTGDSTLIALDALTGALQWQMSLPAKAESLAASPDALYLSAANGHLYGVRLTSPARIAWDFHKVRAIGQPLVDDTQVYFALLDNTVYGFERKGGSQRWSNCLSDRPVTGPLRLGSRLAVALNTGSVVRMDKGGQLFPATARCGAAASAPAPTAKASSASLQGAAASLDGTRLFTVTTAPDSKRMLTAWGPKAPSGTPR